MVMSQTREHNGENALMCEVFGSPVRFYDMTQSARLHKGTGRHCRPQIGIYVASTCAR